MAFTVLYNLSQGLYGDLSAVGPRLLHDDNIGFPNYAYGLFLKILEIDLFITDEFRILSPDLLARNGLDCNLSYYNFLNQLMSLLGSYSDRFQYGEQVKKFRKYSAKWVKESKTAFPLGVDLKKKIDTLLEKIEKNSCSQPNIKGEQKVNIIRRQKDFVQADELIKLSRKTYEAKGVSEPSLYFREFVSLKNIASLDWEKNKSATRLLGGHRKAYDVLLQLEQGLGKKLNLSNDSQGWTEEDYGIIYAELAKIIPVDVLKSRLPEIMIISINCGDARATGLRLNLFAKILGGSADHLEAIPNAIRTQFAVFKYLQGEPEFWDSLIQREEQLKQRKREAQKRKKQAHQRKMVQAVAEEIERKKEIERELLLRKEKEAQTKAEAEALKQKEYQESEPSVSTEIVEPIFAKEESTFEIKRKAQEALAREKEKQEKKDRKNLEVIEQETRQTPEIPAPATPPELSVSLPKITTTRKHYQSLYSISPSLSTKDAIALLGGFGLKTSSAKGSHAKLTLQAGEIITDAAGRVIWQCPNLEELMTIIPRWDGNDIPDYMVKNLRYIIEKIGVKPGSY